MDHLIHVETTPLPHIELLDTSRADYSPHSLLSDVFLRFCASDAPGSHDYVIDFGKYAVSNISAENSNRR